MSDVAIATDQSTSTTTVSFTVTGASDTTGFGNITIPKSAVPYGTTPIIYIDGQQASNQGYTQDSNNYYVWYTTQFSTHYVSIVFTAKSSIPEFPSAIIVLILLIATATAILFCKRQKTDKVKNQVSHKNILTMTDAKGSLRGIRVCACC